MRIFSAPPPDPRPDSSSIRILNLANEPYSHITSRGGQKRQHLLVAVELAAGGAVLRNDQVACLRVVLCVMLWYVISTPPHRTDTDIEIHSFFTSKYVDYIDITI